MVSYANLLDLAKRLAYPIFRFENKMIRRNGLLIDQYEKRNQLLGVCKYLFIGDRHTVGLKKISSNLPEMINVGIEGDTTRGVLLRSKRNISNIKAHTAVIQIGYNDFRYRSADDAFKNYKKIISLVNSKKIYIVSLFPIDYRRSVVNNKIIKFNQNLKKMCDESGGSLNYIDMHEKFYRPNIKGISPELTNDGVHLGKNGNIIYGKILKDILI